MLKKIIFSMLTVGLVLAQELEVEVEYSNLWPYEEFSCITDIISDPPSIDDLINLHNNRKFVRESMHNIENLFNRNTLYIPVVFHNIYKIENEFNKITPHILNPVITDCRIARNAGNIFYDNKNTIIRPSQINISDFYGGGLNLRKIQELNLEKFEYELDRMSHDYRQGIAGLSAFQSMRHSDRPGLYLGIGTGYYRGESSIAIGITRQTRNIAMNFNISSTGVIGVGISIAID